jgi:hypothetical protein
MTVVDFDERTITFVRNGTEVTLTWGELNFLKHYRTEAIKDLPKPARRRNRN